MKNSLNLKLEEKEREINEKRIQLNENKVQLDRTRLELDTLQAEYSKLSVKVLEINKTFDSVATNNKEAINEVFNINHC